MPKKKAVANRSNSDIVLGAWVDTGSRISRNTRDETTTLGEPHSEYALPWILRKTCFIVQKVFGRKSLKFRGRVGRFVSIDTPAMYS